MHYEAHDKDENEQSYLEEFQARLPADVIQDVRKRKDFRNLSPFLAASKWEDKMPSRTYPTKIVLRGVTIPEKDSPLQHLYAGIIEFSRRINHEIGSGTSYHILVKLVPDV